MGDFDTWSILRRMGISNPDSLDPKDVPQNVLITEDNTEQVLKDVMVFALSLIPEVGGLLSGLVGLFWPIPEKPQLTWESIEGKVLAIAKEAVDVERARVMKHNVTGLMETVQLYTEEPVGSTRKAINLGYLIAALASKKSEFLDQQAPWKSLGYLVLFGSLHLCALREQVLYWQQIHGVPDPEPVRRKLTLNKAIEEYTRAIAFAKQKCLEWRLKDVKMSDPYKIPFYELRETLSEEEIRRLRPSRAVLTIAVADPKENIDQKYSWLDGDDSSLQKTIAEVFYRDIRDDARTRYTAALDEILLPSMIWKNLDDDPNNNDTMRITYDHLYKSHRLGVGLDFEGIGIEQGCPITYHNQQYIYEAHGPITKVSLWTDNSNNLCGILVCYGASGGAMFGMQSSRGSTDLNVGSGEIISGWVMNVQTHMGSVSTNKVTALNLSKRRIDDGKNLDQIYVGNTAGTQSFQYNGRDEAARRFGKAVPTLGLLYITGWVASNDNTPYMISRLNFVVGRVNV